MWTLDKVQRAVEQELTDDVPIKEDLMRLQLELDAGEIDDDEYLVRETEIMAASSRGPRVEGEVRHEHSGRSRPRRTRGLGLRRIVYAYCVVPVDLNVAGAPRGLDESRVRVIPSRSDCRARE